MIRYTILLIEILLGFIIHGASLYGNNKPVWSNDIDSIFIKSVNPFVELRFWKNKDKYEIYDNIRRIKLQKEITDDVLDSVILTIDSIYIKNCIPTEIRYDFIDDEIITESMFLKIKIYQNSDSIEFRTALDYYYGEWEIIYSKEFMRLINFIRESNK